MDGNIQRRKGNINNLKMQHYGRGSKKETGGSRT